MIKDIWILVFVVKITRTILVLNWEIKICLKFWNSDASQSGFSLDQYADNLIRYVRFWILLLYLWQQKRSGKKNITSKPQDNKR